MRNSELLSRVGAGESVKRAFRIFFDQPGVFAPIGFTVTLPLLYIVWILHAGGANMATTDPREIKDLSSALSGLFIVIPFFFIATYVGTCATIRATAEVYAGKQPTLKGCLGEGLRRACALFWFGLSLSFVAMVATLLFELATGLVAGVLAFIVSLFGGDGHGIAILAGIVGATAILFASAYAWSAIKLSPSSVVLEKKSVMATLKRSWELVDGSRCYVFGAILIFFLYGFAVGFGVGIASAIFGPGSRAIFLPIWYTVAIPTGNM